MDWVPTYDTGAATRSAVLLAFHRIGATARSLLSWGPSPPGSVPGCATGGRDPVQRNELDRLWSRCPSRTAVLLALSAVACGSGDDPPPVAHPSLVTW